MFVGARECMSCPTPPRSRRPAHRQQCLGRNSNKCYKIWPGMSLRFSSGWHTWLVSPGMSEHYVKKLNAVQREMSKSWTWTITWALLFGNSDSRVASIKCSTVFGSFFCPYLELIINLKLLSTLKRQQSSPLWRETVIPTLVRHFRQPRRHRPQDRQELRPTRCHC